MEKPNYVDPFSGENKDKYLLWLFNSSPLTLLPEVSSVRVSGTGTYALYMPFGHASYPHLTGDMLRPIYVGVVEGPLDLRSRLLQHLESLKGARDIDPYKVLFRSIPLRTRWVKQMRKVLVQKYRPVWNTVVTGFGEPSRRGVQSEWEILHPGRDIPLIPTNKEVLLERIRKNG